MGKQGPAPKDVSLNPAPGSPKQEDEDRAGREFSVAADQGSSRRRTNPTLDSLDRNACWVLKGGEDDRGQNALPSNEPKAVRRRTGAEESDPSKTVDRCAASTCSDGGV